jgi:REP element-mobilizing transposase RayT
MHVVFSTKERRKIIPAQMKERLWSYTAGICQHQGIFVHAMGGMADHIHMLLQFPPTLMIANAIRGYQIELVRLDIPRDRQVRVATGLWRVRGKQVEHCGSGAVH